MSYCSHQGPHTCSTLEHCQEDFTQPAKLHLPVFLIESCCIAGMLGYVELLEHLRAMMYLYHVFSILQLTTVGLLMVRFWRKW